VILNREGFENGWSWMISEQESGVVCYHQHSRETTVLDTAFDVDVGLE